MSEKAPIIINDDLFLNTVSCPLKFIHITNDSLNRDTSKLYFRQRNKLHIRDAISLRFENCRHTSNSTKKAFGETTELLKEETVAITGAVIQQDKVLTRIPILVKNDKKLIIIQVHGKLRKQSEGDEIQPGIKKRSIVRYLLKAAYRLDVLKRQFPDYDVDVHLYFPNKHFKSSIDHLHLFDQASFFTRKKIKRELLELFTKVRATKAVEQIRQQIPIEQSHQYFHNESVSSAIEKIKLMIHQPHEFRGIDRHKSCKYCDFRLSRNESTEGCWRQFFSSEDINHTEKHVFELIGHGNSAESENGTFYQEEAEFSRGFDSLEKMLHQNIATIPILNRRNLQILKARDLAVPSLWIKQSMKSINDLKYPLHFLDFEAATYAIPMKKESRPYTPVYFQFSCHTLHQSGKMIHTEWLDLQDKTIHPHREFVCQLGRIPDIFEGTIMQYSPFEKQGVNRLIADFKREQKKYKKELEILEKIRTSRTDKYEHRFFDVSRIIRDYYFNEYLKDSLGLKQVLQSILKWEQSSEFSDFFDSQVNDVLFGEKGEEKGSKTFDPYKNVKDSDFSISDGSDAMNAWLSYKNGLMTDEEKSAVPEVLKKYCTLDSYALFIIFKHIKRFTGLLDSEDYILLNRNNR
ncbi:DUF2779 domain-containing protein [Rhodohalobacter sulfatireducens]|uniref:DUF2779 domain-containing protein n=1 Tax=Rhodohalobacter sulfatireducens TaxID=2911366 RepID=A0ABS9KDS5_9BACT|nr:DUF2779 domain-containing protein [Rhodohalobacter sulfatireducens]MCG2589014.1 DUF2779 domain-containing protein [Rhodohalobacter sulfatireducens]